MRVAVLALLVLAASGTLGRAGGEPDAGRKRLLAIGESRAYEHDSVSTALATIWKLGRDSGL